MAIAIDDPGDPRLADYRELRDVAARRRIEGDEFFIAEGPVAIERLIHSAHRVRSILLSSKKHARMAELLAEKADLTTYVVDEATLRQIVGFDLHRGAIAAADRLPQPTVLALATTARRLAVLEGLNDPENLGLIARSARALGFDGLILDPTCIDPYTRRTVRVSMGEILHLPTARAGEADWPTVVVEVLQRQGFESWAMTPGEGAVSVWEVDVPERVALWFGAEGPGLRPSTIALCDQKIIVPIRPDVDSLNVAASAAAAFAIIQRPRSAD